MNQGNDVSIDIERLDAISLQESDRNYVAVEANDEEIELNVLMSKNYNENSYKKPHQATLHQVLSSGNPRQYKNEQNLRYNSS